jgi:hypothetical protein
MIGVRFFACSSSVRAYRTALACKVWMRGCAPLRRPTCFGLVCTCRFHECGGIGQCVFAAQRLHLICTVEGRIASRTASVHNRAARISIARRAGHACSSSSTRWWDHYLSWSHCGRFMVHERRHLRPLALRCVCNSACDGRVAAPVYMPMQWNTRGNHRSVSASGCTMRCDGRSSSSRAAGSTERSLRAVDPNRSSASADAAKLGGSQAALHRPSAPSSECCRTIRSQTRPRSTTAAPSQAGGLPASLTGPHCGM